MNEHTSKKFDAELEGIRTRVLQMGGMAEEQVRKAIDGLHNGDIALLESVIRNDALRARNEFGFLRMWSIHPNQIMPIVEALRPDFSEVETATAILAAAQDTDWAPIAHEGKLHDRASYRYYWELLERAHITGMQIPSAAREAFFA